MNKYKQRFFGQDKFRKEDDSVLNNINLTKAWLTLKDFDDFPYQSPVLVVPETLKEIVEISLRGESTAYFLRRKRQREFIKGVL